MAATSLHMSLLLLAVSFLAGTRAGNVSWDERSAIIDGERQLMLSGAVHYARLLPSDWDRVLRMAQEMGLNTVQTYVMWNFHEPTRGNLTWSGRQNITHFVQLAANHGLKVVIRIGPYVCGEYQFGGLPVWLRTLDGIKCFRCSDPIWKREMARFVAAVVEQVSPFLITKGGPVVMLQVENEYNGGDQAYLNWAVEMARNLTTEVPWNLCHDLAACSKVNTDSHGSYQFKTLCTINGFWMEEKTRDYSQPSPKWLSDLRTQNPGQPGIWTEDQGWFDQWQVAQRVRDPADQAYGIARFFAYGGSWHNFYMLTGGNNYGRQSGGEVVTAYAPDTAIDYLLLKHQPRYSHYGNLFKVLSSYSHQLLSNPIATAQPLTNTSNTSEYLSLTPCTDTDPAHAGTLDASQQWHLESCGFLRNSRVSSCVNALPAVYTTVTLESCSNHTDPALSWSYNKSSQQLHSAVVADCMASKSKGQQCHRCMDTSGGSNVDSWDCKTASDPQLANQQWEPYTSKAGSSGIKSASGLCLTATASGGGGAEVHEYGGVAFLSNYGDVASLDVHYKKVTYHVPNHTVLIIDTATGVVAWNSSNVWGYDVARTNPSYTTAVQWTSYTETPGNGVLKQNSTQPLEMLELTNDQTDYLWYSAVLKAQSNAPRVSVNGAGGTILYPIVRPTSTLEGSGSGDVQLDILACAMGISNSGVGPGTVKGIEGVVKLDGAEVNTTWTHSWMLQGEDKQIYTDQGSSTVHWEPVTTQIEANATVVWFKAHFDLPTIPAPAPAQMAYALDLSSMNKGVAYVNGFNIGRYWLVPGQCTGACAPPVKSGHCYMHWKGCGKPTQTLYHVPEGLLRPTGNLVVLFEETANSVQPRRLADVRLRLVDTHPSSD